MNHETRNPEPETRNPKPETRNPKPETRNSNVGASSDAAARGALGGAAECGWGAAFAIPTQMLQLTMYISNSTG